MENRFVIIHCPYTGRIYIYTKTNVNGKICVDIVRIDQKSRKEDKDEETEDNNSTGNE